MYQHTYTFNILRMNITLQHTSLQIIVFNMVCCVELNWNLLSFRTLSYISVRFRNMRPKHQHFGLLTSRFPFFKFKKTFYFLLSCWTNTPPPLLRFIFLNFTAYQNIQKGKFDIVHLECTKTLHDTKKNAHESGFDLFMFLRKTTMIHSLLRTYSGRMQ